MLKRHLSLADRAIAQFDFALRTVFGRPDGTGRENPAYKPHQEHDVILNDQQRKQVVGFMRVNHAGEVAAQALYHGQALTARDDEVSQKMKTAAEEENDHLLWCQQRLHELGANTSVLGPLWYTGSFTIGALAGLAGDRVSLGFVAETEKQVTRHLESHLEKLPQDDHRSRAILEQMKDDEIQHGHAAMAAGGVELPKPVRQCMKLTAKIMTKTAYYI